MQDLKVVGVDSGSLLLMSDEGERFRITLDEIAQAGVRSPAAAGETKPTVAGRRLPPREIQAQIRAGLSAADVASVTGADLSYIQRFEGPVLAEREYVVEAALAVPVHSPLDTGPLGDGSNFGTVIRRRLAERGATEERWSSWKESTGPWMVKLTYQLGEGDAGVEHDARWTFDAKRSLLAPFNGEATHLSQQGEPTSVLIPRLRAVSPTTDAGASPSAANTAEIARHPSVKAERATDSSRFDSGAFTPIVVESDVAGDEPDGETAPGASDAGVEEPASLDRRRSPWEPKGGSSSVSDTGDLLESLRRRRGQREVAPAVDEEFSDFEDVFDDDEAIEPGFLTSVADDRNEPDERSRDFPGTTVIDIPLDSFTAPTPTAPDVSGESERRSRRNSTGSHGRRGRAAMPSWDEIVFGTKPDDDPA